MSSVLEGQGAAKALNVPWLERYSKEGEGKTYPQQAPQQPGVMFVAHIIRPSMEQRVGVFEVLGLGLQRPPEALLRPWRGHARASSRRRIRSKMKYKTVSTRARKSRQCPGYRSTLNERREEKVRGSRPKPTQWVPGQASRDTSKPPLHPTRVKNPRPFNTPPSTPKQNKQPWHHQANSRSQLPWSSALSKKKLPTIRSSRTKRRVWISWPTARSRMKMLSIS
jgi:hypothetical protein